MVLCSWVRYFTHSASLHPAVEMISLTTSYSTNRMWFSVVRTLINNDMRDHSGQNVVDSRGTVE